MYPAASRRSKKANVSKTDRDARIVATVNLTETRPTPTKLAPEQSPATAYQLLCPVKAPASGMTIRASATLKPAYAEKTIAPSCVLASTVHHYDGWMLRIVNQVYRTSGNEFYNARNVLADFSKEIIGAKIMLGVSSRRVPMPVREKDTGHE